MTSPPPVPGDPPCHGEHSPPVEVLISEFRSRCRSSKCPIQELLAEQLAATQQLLLAHSQRAVSLLQAHSQATDSERTKRQVMANEQDNAKVPNCGQQLPSSDVAGDAPRPIFIGGGSETSSGAADEGAQGSTHYPPSELPPLSEVSPQPPPSKPPTVTTDVAPPSAAMPSLVLEVAGEAHTRREEAAPEVAGKKNKARKGGASPSAVVPAPSAREPVATEAWGETGDRHGRSGSPAPAPKDSRSSCDYLDDNPVQESMVEQRLSEPNESAGTQKLQCSRGGDIAGGVEPHGPPRPPVPAVASLPPPPGQAPPALMDEVPALLLDEAPPIVQDEAPPLLDDVPDLPGQPPEEAEGSSRRNSNGFADSDLEIDELQDRPPEELSVVPTESHGSRKKRSTWRWALGFKEKEQPPPPPPPPPKPEPKKEMRFAVEPEEDEDEDGDGEDRKMVAQKSTKELDRKKSYQVKSLYRSNSTSDAFHAQQGKPVFADAAAMKEKLKAAIGKQPYSVADYYSTSGIWQRLARALWFEHLTLSVIGANAIWIAVDTDYNKAAILLDAHPIFIVAENFFCAYFLFEWVVRFMAFESKRNCRKDAWFAFDSILMSVMLMETWITSAVFFIIRASGGSSESNAEGISQVTIFRVLRLLRLSRMARMVRLLKATPELMVMIKAMGAAMRSVTFTLIILVVLVYVFSIAFTQMMEGTEVGRNDFNGVLVSMNTLLLTGALPDQAEIVNTVGGHHFAYRIVMLLYIFLSTLTVMNMLVGILCEVVSIVSSVEKEELLINFVKGELGTTMTLHGIDTNGRGITREEFGELLEQPYALKALKEVGVDAVGLVDFADFIFSDAESITFAHFMDTVLQLRGSNVATVKDVVDLRKFMTTAFQRIETKFDSAGFGSQVPSVENNDGADDDCFHPAGIA